MADSDDKQRRADTWLGVFRRFGRLWGFLVFLVAVVFAFRQIVLPFILAAGVAYLLGPIVNRLQPRLGRGGAIAVCYLLILGLMAAIVGFLLPALMHDVAKMRDGIPVLIERINAQWLPNTTDWIDNTFGAVMPESVGPELPPTHELAISVATDGRQIVHLDELKLLVHEAPGGGWLIESARGLDDAAGIDEFLSDLVGNSGSELTLMIGDVVGTAVAKIASFLTQFVLTFMLAGFLLMDLTGVLRFVRWIVPPEHRPNFDEIVRGVDQGMAGVIRGQLIICVVNGVLTYIGLLLIGVKYSLSLALVATVFSLIPIFGTILSSIPIIIIAMVSTPSGDFEFSRGVAALAWISGIHLVEANYLNPKIIGSSAQIHPVIVVFALLAGESVAGLTGALLAVPVASMIQTVFLYARRHASAFPGEELGPSPGDTFTAGSTGDTTCIE